MIGAKGDEDVDVLDGSVDEPEVVLAGAVRVSSHERISCSCVFS